MRRRRPTSAFSPTVAPVRPMAPSWSGVTATPERGDHQSLRPVFDEIVYQKSLVEMMQAGYLADLRAIQVLAPGRF